MNIYGVLLFYKIILLVYNKLLYLQNCLYLENLDDPFIFQLSYFKIRELQENLKSFIVITYFTSKKIKRLARNFITFLSLIYLLSISYHLSFFLSRYLKNLLILPAN